jgi:transcriptional regulator with XRE-family HTH domain
MHDDPFFRELGQRIRRLREAAGYSQEDMLGLGFSPRHWQQIEAGRPITLRTLLRICGAFQCPMDRLLGGINRRALHSHEVMFYFDSAAFLKGLTDIVATALHAGDSAIVMAIESHWTSLDHRLRGHGVDVDVAVKRGTLVSLDASEMLSKIMVKGMPDLNLFSKELRELLKSAAKAARTNQPRVAIFGECVGLLYAKGNLDAALSLEKARNDLLKERDIPSVDILCAYPFLHSPKRAFAFRSICAEHSVAFIR